jgi:WD domain, G-beta repeat
MAVRTRRRRKIEAPFPGLRPFLAGENLIFFGREGQSNELIDRLRQNRFLAVLGSSGSGKSSLVRAGLQPDLEGGLMACVAPNWKVATIRPGDRPTAHLAEALATLVSDPDDPGFQIIPAATMIMTMLQASSFGLQEAAMGPILGSGDNLLVIVDQFEEIFRFNEETKDARQLNEAKSFVRLLLEASSAPNLPIYVVITMRSDFLGECPRFDGLAEAINRGQYLVPRLSRSQLREAITSPIAVFEESIAPDLVIRILNDIGDNADQLPILQHALMRTWDHHCAGQEIVMADYEEIGGLSHALNQHAEEIYEELERKGLGMVVERLFKALTQMEGEGKGIRRPTRLSEVCTLTGATMAQVQTVVEAFRGPGRTFLMPPLEVPLEADTILDISHESFMRLWIRLVAWVREETLSAEEYFRLSRAAQDFKLGKVNLWRQPELGIALKWRETMHPTAIWAARYDHNFVGAMAFLDQSQAASLQEEEDKAAMLLLQRKSEERKLTVRRLVILIGLMSGMLALSVGALIYALRQSRVAEEQTQIAEYQKAIANNRADSLKVASIENACLFEEAEEKRHAIADLNNRLTRQLDTIIKQRIILEERFGTTKAQRDSLQQIKNRLAKTNTDLQNANGKLSAQNVLQDSLRRVAEEARGKSDVRSSLLEGFDIAQQSLESPNQETAALLAMRAYHILVDNKGDINDPRIYAALHAALERYVSLIVTRFAEPINAMSYNVSDGSATLLSLSGRLLQFHWENLKSGAKPINGMRQLDNRFVYHGDGGKTVFVADLANQLLVYKSNVCYQMHSLSAHIGQVTGAMEVPGKKIIYSCGRDGKVILWNLNEAVVRPKVVYQDPRTPMECLALDASGNTLVVGSTDQLLVFNTQKQTPPQSFAVPGVVTALALSADGKVLVYGLGNGTVGYGDFKKGSKRSFPIHKSRITALAFSPDGKYVASSSYDQSLRLWRTNHFIDPPIVLRGHENLVTGLCFSRDSKMLFSVSNDKTMRYWYTGSEDLFAALSATATRQEFTKPEMMQYNLPYKSPNEGKNK